MVNLEAIKIAGKGFLASGSLRYIPYMVSQNSSHLISFEKIHVMQNNNNDFVVTTANLHTAIEMMGVLLELFISWLPKL